MHASPPPLLLYLLHNTLKYFPECNQIQKKKIFFPKIIFIWKIFEIKNILKWKKRT